MNILLVGGSGLVGTKLAGYLAEKGNKVICFNRTKPKEASGYCIYELGDLGEYGLLYQTMKKYKIDCVIHNAAISHPMLFRDNPYKVYRVNVEGTLHVLEAARLFEVKRFIYISSGAVYGNTKIAVVDEELKLHGESPYGASKVACEEIVRNYGLETAALRIGFVYGPGRSLECPVENALRHAIEGKELVLKSGRDQMMDYIYIDDCVEAIAAIAEAKELHYPAYNVGGGCLVPYSDVLGIIHQLYPNSSLKVGPGGLGYDDLGAMSIKRIKRDTAWSPKVTMREGIKKYALWMERMTAK